MMCLVIDTCSFSSVFNEAAQQHSRFGPIVRWLTSGNGKIIIGGTKYKGEIKGTSFTRILIEFQRKGKVVLIPDAKVDAWAARVKKIETRDEFDDEHLVALVAISGCCVVCTEEKKAIKYLKRKSFYPVGVKPPKIYRYNSHAALCCNDHVVAVCR